MKVGVVERSLESNFSWTLVLAISRSIFTVVRCARGGKTGKTVVLPGFCEMERIGGAPPCYSGLIWLGRARPWGPCVVLSQKKVEISQKFCGLLRIYEL